MACSWVNALSARIADSSEAGDRDVPSTETEGRRARGREERVEGGR